MKLLTTLLMLIPLFINDENRVKKPSEAFSEINLIRELERSNIKFKRVVLAQAKLESGRFKSKIFRENNNLFGMKLAKKRKTLAIGKRYNHAVYSNWIHSVRDFKLWQDAYCSKIKTEEQYLEYLDRVYSENSEYIKILKKMI